MAAPQTTDDGIGFLKRRALRLQAAGIRAIGPTQLHPPATPRGVARIKERKAEAATEREHRDIVQAELAAIDQHVRWLRDQLGSPAGRDSYRDQELRRELAQLAELRREVEAERPITTNRDGAPLTDRDRAIRRARSRELAEMLWWSAGRAAASGDHRQARRNRVDALRARQVAEYEMHWRTSLPGYSSPWN